MVVSDLKRRQAAISKKTKSKQNPFDVIANSRKKHEIVNRRVKGEDRNVGRARAKVDKNKYNCY
jgi:hypothetical protein